MAEGALSIKLRCASWQQLATIYKRDLSHGTMFLRAAAPPAVGTAVRIDLTLPSATVIVLEGVVGSHVQDPQRGNGVELALSPIPASSVWLIESALASEHRRLATPARGVPVAGGRSTTGSVPAIPSIPSIHENADVAAAEQDLIKALVSEAESLRKLNPFLVLGVGYEAGDAEVRAAFGELTKRYHPDRFARYESAELRQLAAEIFILIRDAYRRLGDPAARAQVLQSLGKSTSAPRAVPVPRPPAAVPPPRTGPRAATTTATPVAPAPGAPVTAAPVPSMAAAPVTAAPVAPVAAAPVTAAPVAPVAAAETLPVPAVLRPPAEPRRDAVRRPTGAPAAPAVLDPAELVALEDLIDQGRVDDALAAYRRLARRHAHDRNVRAGVELCEGLRALAARDRLEAAQRFEAALEIDPSNERAARELADMRRQATNERKGLLGRLMGKKEV